MFEIEGLIYDDLGGEFEVTGKGEILTYEEARLWGHPDNQHPGCVEVEFVEFVKLNDLHSDDDPVEGDKEVRAALEEAGFDCDEVEDKLLLEVNVDEIIRDREDSRW